MLKPSIDLEDDVYEGRSLPRKDVFKASESDSEFEKPMMEDLSEASVEEESEQNAFSEKGDLYEEYDQIQSDVGIADLKRRVEKEQKRGQAVQRDLKAWKECLDIRIALQKPWIESHRLPPKTVLAQFIESQPSRRESSLSFNSLLKMYSL